MAFKSPRAGSGRFRCWMERAGRATWVWPLFVSFSFGKGLNDHGGTRRAVALFGHDLGFLSVALRPAAGARRACLRTLKALLESKGRGRRRTVGLVAPGGRDATSRCRRSVRGRLRGEEGGGARELEVFVGGELGHEVLIHDRDRVMHEIGELQVEEFALRGLGQAGSPVHDEQPQRPDRQAARDHFLAVDFEVGVEEVFQALGGHVVVVIGEAVTQLEEGHDAVELRAGLQHAGDFLG